MVQPTQGESVCQPPLVRLSISPAETGRSWICPDPIAGKLSCCGVGPDFSVLLNENCCGIREPTDRFTVCVQTTGAHLIVAGLAEDVLELSTFDSGGRSEGGFDGTGCF